VFWSTLKSTKPDWLRDHSIRLLVQLALEKHPELPDVPLVLNYAKTPEDRQALELIFAPQLPGRPFIAPPGIPAERLTALQDAFMATLKDPAFLAEAKKRDIEIQAKSGAEVRDFVARIYQTPKDIVERVNKVRLGQ
jgi:hypothetical protein